jgi:hypothetical protein
MSAAWKDLERRKCRDLGGQRRGQVGPGGWARGSDDDGTLPVSLQCKRTSHYQLRTSWIVQARKDAKADGRPWVLAIEQHNDRHGGLAVVPWPYFVELMIAAGRVPLPAGTGSSPPATQPRQLTSATTPSR